MKEQKNTSNGMPYGQNTVRNDQQRNDQRNNEHKGQNKPECNDRRPEEGKYGQKMNETKETYAPKRSADYAVGHSAKTSETKASAAKSTASRSTTHKTTATGRTAAAKSTAKTTTASAKHPAEASKSKK